MTLFDLTYKDLSINQKINFKTWNTKPDKEFCIFFTIQNVIKGILVTKNIPIEDRQINEPCMFNKYCRKD